MTINEAANQAMNRACDLVQANFHEGFSGDSEEVTDLLNALVNCTGYLIEHPEDQSLADKEILGRVIEHQYGGEAPFLIELFGLDR